MATIVRANATGAAGTATIAGASAERAVSGMAAGVVPMHVFASVRSFTAITEYGAENISQIPGLARGRGFSF